MMASMGTIMLSSMSALRGVYRTHSAGIAMTAAVSDVAGTPTEAPECQALATNQFLQPGTSFTTDAEEDVGVEHYQCCIHPWMRTEVTVVAR